MWFLGADAVGGGVELGPWTAAPAAPQGLTRELGAHGPPTTFPLAWGPVSPSSLCLTSTLGPYLRSLVDLAVIVGEGNCACPLSPKLLLANYSFSGFCGNYSIDV